MAYTVTNNPWSSQYNVGIGTDSPVSHMHLVTGTAQTDDDGQLKIEQTNTTSGAAATNAGMNTKNYHGTSQFMQWEDNGLRIGSRNINPHILYFLMALDSMLFSICLSFINRLIEDSVI